MSTWLATMSDGHTDGMNETPRYYVPHSSIWPIIGSVSLFLTAFGAVHFIHQSTEKVAAEGSFGGPLFFVGLATIGFMMFGWFGAVVRENLKGMVSDQLDVSFRMGMAWFIVSEIMFFAAFFGALFYARLISVPWLSGAGNNLETHLLLWPDFAETWPLFRTPGGTMTESICPLCWRPEGTGHEPGCLPRSCAHEYLSYVCVHCGKEHPDRPVPRTSILVVR